jgi:hypothetical protein
VVALGEDPSSPPDPPNRHGGVASGQCRRSWARSVREPSIGLQALLAGPAHIGLYEGPPSSAQVAPHSLLQARVRTVLQRAQLVTSGEFSCPHCRHVTTDAGAALPATASAAARRSWGRWRSPVARTVASGSDKNMATSSTCSVSSARAIAYPARANACPPRTSVLLLLLPRIAPAAKDADGSRAGTSPSRIRRSCSLNDSNADNARNARPPAKSPPHCKASNANPTESGATAGSGKTMCSAARNRNDRHCCVERVRAILGLGETLHSDAERELLECGADPVSWRLFGNDLVVAAAQVLHEGVAGGDGARGGESFQSAHRP